MSSLHRLAKAVTELWPRPFLRKASARRLAAVSAVLVIATAGCTAEEPTPQFSPPPNIMTLAGACETLLGPELEGGGLVDGMIDVSDLPLEERQPVQDGLFEIVIDGPESLQAPAGVLVDLLDNPRGEFDEGEPGPTVRGAIDSIQHTCGAT